MTAMCGRLAIVSAERVRDELVKLVLGDDPRAGLDLLVQTGLAQLVLPELPALALEVDEHHRHKDVYEHTLIVLEQAIELETTHEPVSGPDFVLRFAALMHDVGKPAHPPVRGRRARLVPPPRGGRRAHDAQADAGAALLQRPHRRRERSSSSCTCASTGTATASGPTAPYAATSATPATTSRRLHKLTRADCTTRNKRKADKLARTYDDLEERIARLSEEEELASIRPALDGNRIMELLDIPPGREVGEAYRMLLEVRLDRGPMTEDEAEAVLRAWWADRTA